MTVAQWSTSASLNVLSSGTVGTGGIGIDEGMFADKVNDAMRDIMAQIATQFGKVNVKSTDIASATPALSAATGQYVHITGTTTITSFGTVTAGAVFFLEFDAAVGITYNATSMILPGATSITTAAGDMAVFISEGSGNWRMLSYQPALYKGADKASAGALALNTATGSYVHVTGTTTITGLGTVAAGRVFILEFDAALTLTYNATSLILPGAADIITAAGDIGIFVSEGSGNWRCVNYQRAAVVLREYLVPLALLGTGTTKDLTVSTDIVEFDLTFIDVSLNGADTVSFWLGDAGGVEIAGYAGASELLSNAGAVGIANITTSMVVGNAAAASVYQGRLKGKLHDAATNTWVITAWFGHSNTTADTSIVYKKALSQPITTVRIGSTAGTAVFDGGGSLAGSYKRPS